MNNIDIHVNKTSSYCHIDLYDKASDKNISFYVNNTNLLSKDIKDTVFLQEDLLKAYELEDRAVIEATTYTNHLSLLVDAQDFTLVSEDINRVAVFNGETPVTQVTAVKVINEEGNELRSSMHIDEENNTIELYIEEEEVSKAINKTTVVIEFAPYVEFTSGRAIYLRTFNELDYWYDLTNREIYTVDKYNNKELYIKLSVSHISGSSYPYQVPTMISETVFFSNYKKCFFKIEKAGEKPTITKIKDETSFFGMTYLYDNVWVTAYKDTSTNSYQYQIIEFTDIETASYEILDSHVIEIGKSVSEYSYFPYVIYNYDDKLAISFYSYQYNSYLPTTDQYVCAKIDKENKCFSLDGIEPMQHLTYEDDEYRLIFNWSDRKYYANGSILSGHYTYPAKPLTLREGNRLYGYTISYNDIPSEIAEFYLDNSKNMAYDTFLQRIWNNGSYAGTKSIDAKPVTDIWDVFKDTDIKKRSIRATTVDDYIIPEGVTSNLGSVKLNNNSIYLKKEVIQNKKFLSTVAYSTCQLLQRDKVIASAITVAENTDIEMRTYSSASVSFSNQYILTEEKDFNIYKSLSDVHRVVENNIYDLQIDENATIIDKIDDKYDLNLAQWGEYTETFEDYPNTLIRWTNSTYNEHGLMKSDIRAYEGSYSGYMGREEKGSSSIPDYYSEFVTIGDEISFNYYNSFTQYNQKLMIYLNGVEVFSDADNSNDWKPATVKLKPNMLNTVKIFYEDSIVEPSNDKGFFIDNLKCNAPIPSNEAVIYFNAFDLGMYSSPQGANIKFNDLEISDNITQTIYYSLDAGTTWEIFKGMLPNKDNISLKAVFTKPSIEEEAYIRFSSVTVMPGEIDWVTNIDTNRKIYDTSDIVPELIENVSVSKGEDNRYNLSFKDGITVVETFDAEPVINYTLHKPSGIFYKSEITNENSYSGENSLGLKWGAKSMDTNESNQPRITFKTKATQLKFMARQYAGSEGIICVFVNGKKIRHTFIQNSSSYIELTYDLNLTEEADVSIGYTGSSQGVQILIDNITLVGETVTVDITPYIETEVVDLSIFPSDITCELVTDDLQASHDLNTQYFYTINDGQDWIEFNKTLPNSSNVRLKAVFTKDTEEEVIASFKNLIIRQDDGSTIKATIRLATTRTVHASNDKSYETSREVVNTAKTTILTQRQVFKDIDMALTTNRKTAINDETTILTQREVVRVNTVKKNLDTIRHIHKSLINSLDTIRSSYNNVSSMVDTKVVVTNTEEATIDTKRQVWNIIEVDKRIDTTRIVYITASSFVTQLNIDLKLSKGTLLLDNQEFN